MKTTKQLAAITALVATLATPSLFAEDRRRDATDDRRGHSNQSRSIAVEGRVSDIDRNRNEIVIRLDRGNYVLVADRNTSGLRSVERGDFIRATGSVNRGRMHVDRISELRDEDHRGGRDDRFLSGVVQRVDQRANVAWVQLDRTNRVVAVEGRRVDNLRRGQRITARGDWQRNGRFEAERIDVR
ncbi:MAG TPA: hypothetical protein VGQ76_13595 [Thermoanaerobaculia bacterium]|nr:hypothetical protein [Thermoanaerobaculia bacterium]